MDLLKIKSIDRLNRELRKCQNGRIIQNAGFLMAAEKQVEIIWRKLCHPKKLERVIKWN